MMTVTDMPRLLMITRNLPPLRGGMERLNHHLLRELSEEFTVHACCPEDCVPQLPAGIGGTALPLRPLSRFVTTGAFKAIRKARQFRPHLVLAGSGLTAPLALAAARASGAKSAAYLHGLDVVVSHWAYQRLWVPRFRDLDMVLANSHHTASLALRAGVQASRMNILHPGVDRPSSESGAGQAFRRSFELGNRPLLLSLGRLTARKGIAEFVEAVMPRLLRVFPDLCLVVIGAEAVHALRGGTRRECERIQSVIDRLSLQNHVKLLGEQSDVTVRGAFLASKALVFPVREMAGDVEGFGMVAIEAAAHGVPTVAFAVGGVVDAVADPDTGRLITPGDYVTMAERLVELLASPVDAANSDRRCRDFAARFEWGPFGARLRSLCKQLLETP